MFGRRYNAFLDPHGIFGDPFSDNFDGDDFRAGFANVSKRATQACENAEKNFLKHLSTVDTSKGPVTEEIIKFHLVPDMKKRFHNFAKAHGCTAKSRKLAREEQDRINKTRTSLMIFTSVTVTPEAQKAYLRKQVAKKSGPSDPTTSGTGLSEPLSPVPQKALKRTANQALDDAAGPSKPTKKSKA